MAYGQEHGRKPFERASKIAHTTIVRSEEVQTLLGDCVLPSAPKKASLQALIEPVPEVDVKISHVIAIDGGLTEVSVRKEFPTASIAFMTFGPLLLQLTELDNLDEQVFLAPEDMAVLKNIQRYPLAVPTQAIRRSTGTFSEGVRSTVQEFLAREDGHLMKALQWLLFRQWDPKGSQAWKIPRCPNPTCDATDISFTEADHVERACVRCGGPIYLSDAFRLYERIDDELGAGAILAYLLTALEQLVLVHLIQSVYEMKSSQLTEVLFVKDGPLAFFGVTAPLHAPMRELMKHLATSRDEPLINLVGLEKSGPFVEHAALIEPLIEPGNVLVLSNDYIYRYIVPGDPSLQSFGHNTYYGKKAIFRSPRGDTYVATIPAFTEGAAPKLAHLVNGAQVLNIVSRLRCSMYDNALLPIALANRLVSLADVPSSRILEKFVGGSIKK